MVINYNKFNRIHGLTPLQKSRILCFLQGMAYSWCKNNPAANLLGSQWFSAQMLVGGANNDWKNTPLTYLYDHYIAAGHTPANAYKRAGIAVGWLLARVLIEDKRIFDTKRIVRKREYRWTGSVNPKVPLPSWLR